MKDQTEKTFYQIKGKVREEAEKITKNDEKKVEVIAEKNEGEELEILGDTGEGGSEAVGGVPHSSERNLT
nr:hypothetical protein [uncultured Desulfobulbus sp.]